MKKGIYQIKNLINGKIYIGSAVNFEKRKWEHFSKSEKASQLIVKAIDKYGIENFIFTPIEYCPNCNQQELYKREQFWLDILTPYNENIGYNISKVAEGGNGGTKESALKSNITKREKGWNKQTYPKLSTSKLGSKNPMYGRIEEKSSSSKPIYIYNREGVFIKEYKCQKIAKKELGLKSLHFDRGYEGDYLISREYKEKLNPKPRQRWRSTNNI